MTKPRLCFCLVAVVLATSVRVGLADPKAPKTDKGFTTLFDGKSLDAWQGDTNRYRIENGVLVCTKQGGRLFTKQQFSDFAFQFEFKLTAGANNGVAIRSPLAGDPAYVGMEVQILDDSAKQYAKLKPYQYHGSVYGVAAAKRGHLKKVGQWNQQEIVCRGRRVTVRLNGETIVDVDLDEASNPKTVDGRDHPGLKRKTGYIGFLGHGHRIEFRNIRVKSFESDDK